MTFLQKFLFNYLENTLKCKILSNKIEYIHIENSIHPRFIFYFDGNERYEYMRVSLISINSIIRMEVCHTKFKNNIDMKTLNYSFKQYIRNKKLDRICGIIQ